MDDCSTTRELKGSVTNGLTGVVTPRSSRIIELATGLNFQDSSGVWTESQDLIEPLTDGGAAAVHGRYKAYFSPAGLNDDAALTIVSQSNRVYQARVLGIYYFDAQSGQSNLLATPSDTAVAEILPPNQIVFRGAFNSPKLKADLRYTYTKAAIESDLIITSQPKVSPADCGLNPETTRLQIRHQWIGAPVPGIQQREFAQASGPALVDQTLDFGDLWFPAGRAFTFGGNSDRGTNAATISLPSPADGTNWVPVGKEWQPVDGKATLIESVTWNSVAPDLAQLPRIAKAGDPKETRLAAAPRQVAPPRDPARGRGVVRLAAKPYTTPGVVLDFTGVSGSGSYRFNEYSPSGPLYNPSGGTTYTVSSNCYFSGTLTFDAGCVVKFYAGYPTGPYLLTYAGVTCNYASGIPSVLTSVYDPVYGDPVGLGGAPSQTAGTALWLYYLNTNVTVSGMVFRYATTALQACDNGGATVANCSFYNCQTGIWADYYHVTIQTSTWCVVTTPTSYYGYFNGSLTAATAPTITTSPSSQCKFVYPAFSSITFTGLANTSCVHTWSLEWNGSVLGSSVGMSSSVNVSSNQLQQYGQWYYGGHKVWLFVTDSYGNSGVDGGWIGIVDPSAMAAATNWITHTNGKTCNLWATRTTNNPPTLKWDTTSLLYSNTGFTAISQRNNRDYPYPGTLPVTLLTPRHGYMRGHGTIVPYPDPYQGFNTNVIGMKVYFCTASDTLVTATVLMGFTRCQTNYYDYTVLVFDNDVAATIQPMEVSYSLPTSYSVVFNTTQGGYMSANNPPLPLSGPADPDAFPPFNSHPTYLAGDSGSPVMVPATDGTLVFLYGDTTTGPCSQMQGDMNTLSVYAGCWAYLMIQHTPY